MGADNGISSKVDIKKPNEVFDSEVPVPKSKLFF